jgi:hypothetical protein
MPGAARPLSPARGQLLAKPAVCGKRAFALGPAPDRLRERRVPSAFSQREKGDNCVGSG